MNEVKERIKAHEGYRLSPYHCTEGHLTGGWGHKILDGEDVPTTQEGWIALFDKDYDKAHEGAKTLVYEHLTGTGFSELEDKKKNILKQRRNTQRKLVMHHLKHFTREKVEKKYVE